LTPLRYVIQCNDILNLSSGRIKAQHKLSVADAFIAATALLLNASLSKEINMIPLPYKHAN